MEVQSISGPDIISTQFSPREPVPESEIVRSEEVREPAQRPPEEARGQNIDTYA